MGKTASLAATSFKVLFRALVVVMFLAAPFHHLAESALADTGVDTGHGHHRLSYSQLSHSHESAAKAHGHAADAGDHQHQHSSDVDADKCGEFCHSVAGMVPVHGAGLYQVYHFTRFEISERRGDSLTLVGLRRPPRT